MPQNIVAPIVIVLLTLFGGITSVAQVNPSEADVDKIFEFTKQGKYLAALAVCEAASKSSPMLAQELATLRSFVGDAPGALSAMDDAEGAAEKPETVDAELFANARPQPAIARIVELARTRKIVIINEAHHVARHRAFTQQLLEGLWDQGFRYFAAETLNPFTDKLAELKYPVRDTGYYSCEPFYGDLIRTALRIGFRPVAYETTSSPIQGDGTDRINAREADQCQNLMERVFNKDPEAKVVIHVGYSHATEDTRKLADGRELLWMAARLAKATGLDPLTIDQTAQNERGSVERSPAAWRLACERELLQGPTVFELDSGQFLVAGNYQGKIDVQVFHPASKPESGRSDWVQMNGYRKLMAIPENIQPTESRVLVQAFAESESEDAIPLDQVLIVSGQPRPSLALPSGSYRIVVQNEQGQQLGEPQLLTVNEGD